MSALERRYRALLRAYPRAYRADRGAEIAGTLLDDSRPGQQWPSARDVRAVVLGGLRLRTGTDRLPRRALWRDALHLAAILALVGRVVSGFDSRFAEIYYVPSLFAASTAVSAAALVAVVFHRYVLGLVLVAAEAVLVGVAFGPAFRSHWLTAQVLPLALVAGLVLARRRGRAWARTPGALVAGAVVVGLPLELSQITSVIDMPVKTFALLAVAVVGAVVAAVVDPRLLLAVPFVLAGNVLPEAYSIGADIQTFGLAGLTQWPATALAFVAVEVGLTLVLLPVGWVVGRRRATI